MMDCSKTEVFLAEWKRMCANIGGCHKCKIYKLTDPSRICVDGGGAFAKEPEKCIAIVQEWSDQHPVKTRLSVLKEQYPNARFNKGTEVPYACVRSLYGIECPFSGKATISHDDCNKCWNTPIEGDNNA